MDGNSLGFPPQQPGLTSEPAERLPADSSPAAAKCPDAEVHLFLGMPAVIRSEAMRRLLQFVERVGRSSAAVLITGESGTGKELIARALHTYSPRAGRPWIDLNCACWITRLITGWAVRAKSRWMRA